MNKDKLKSIIESLLFLWGDPISIKDIEKCLKIDKKDLKMVLDQMKSEYEIESSGLRLIEVNESYQLSTKPENFDFIKDFVRESAEKNLTKPSLETLSIIAYKQPVTKMEIEDIRGVNCDSTIKGLLDSSLIEISGTLDRIGHPNLYVTTDFFLKKFGIKNLEELPSLEDLRRD